MFSLIEVLKFKNISMVEILLFIFLGCGCMVYNNNLKKCMGYSNIGNFNNGNFVYGLRDI